MSLIFMDGFDHYATADINKKWTSVTGSPTIGASTGRRSGGAIFYNSSTNTIKSFASAASVIVGFAFNLQITTTTRILLSFRDSASVQVDLRVNAGGTLSVTRAGVALTDGTSTNALSTGTFYYIEFKVTIANSISAGSCKVRVNGVDWLTVAIGQDTQVTANASVNELLIGSSGTNMNGYVDDLYLCNSSGSTNNDFLGDCRIDALYPTSDGNYSQFTPSTGTDHYALVDESTPNTSDYNESSTLNHIDSYGMGNLPTSPTTVYGVQVCDAALKDDAGARGLSPFIRSSSTDSVGTELSLSTSQLYALAIWETDPATSAAWTVSGVNAAEVGGKVTT